jgi:hypothetical protein
MSTPLALLDVLAQIPDPRDPRGIRHPLSAILSLAVLAMLTGAKSYSAGMSRWIQAVDWMDLTSLKMPHTVGGGSA